MVTNSGHDNQQKLMNLIICLATPKLAEDFNAVTEINGYIGQLSEADALSNTSLRGDYFI
jgi:hypothetical protein